MKKIITLLFLTIFYSTFAQKPCEYSTNVTDSIGTLKTTKDYIIFERNFAGNSSYIFFSLSNSDGTPMLNLQTIQKSADFIKANCMDANSKLFLQLTNGKVITMVHTQNENCGTLLRVEAENKYSRINSGSFLFLKGTLEDLKTSPVSLMLIKYGAEILDYVFKKELVSELTKETYYPENYFIDYLNCIN